MNLAKRSEILTHAAEVLSRNAGPPHSATGRVGSCWVLGCTFAFQIPAYLSLAHKVTIKNAVVPFPRMHVAHISHSDVAKLSRTPLSSCLCQCQQLLKIQFTLCFAVSIILLSVLRKL